MGRGKEVGFPTINMQVPEGFAMEPGVYASWVTIDNKVYKGALHYGPIPTFGDMNNSLEVHLIDISEESVPDSEGKLIEVDIVERIRDVKKFFEVGDLNEAIARDIEKIKIILK
jgi:riboflavin kinase/FMN adenylyltransferase